MGSLDSQFRLSADAESESWLCTKRTQLGSLQQNASAPSSKKVILNEDYNTSTMITGAFRSSRPVARNVEMAMSKYWKKHSKRAEGEVRKLLEVGPKIPFPWGTWLTEFISFIVILADFAGHSDSSTFVHARTGSCHALARNLPPKSHSTIAPLQVARGYGSLLLSLVQLRRCRQGRKRIGPPILNYYEHLHFRLKKK